MWTVLIFSAIFMVGFVAGTKLGWKVFGTSWW